MERTFESLDDAQAAITTEARMKADRLSKLLAELADMETEGLEASVVPMYLNTEERSALGRLAAQAMVPVAMVASNCTQREKEAASA